MRLRFWNQRKVAISVILLQIFTQDFTVNCFKEQRDLIFKYVSTVCGGTFNRSGIINE